MSWVNISLLLLACCRLNAQTDAVAAFDSGYVETGNPFVLHLAVPEQFGAPAAVGIMEEVIARHGGVDIIVNNAATNPVFGPMMNADESVFQKIMAVNVQGPLELCKRAVPVLRSRGGGSIVNIASVGGLNPERMLGLYSVSKSALISLTKVMAKEWGGMGIRANAICPGLIKTKFSQALWQNDQVLKQALAMAPISRIGMPQDLAGLAVFLASDAASYCTGGVFVADGGLTV
mgnify:CR=1 FL=1